MTEEKLEEAQKVFSRIKDLRSKKETLTRWLEDWDEEDKPPSGMSHTASLTLPDIAFEVKNSHGFEKLKALVPLFLEETQEELETLEAKFKTL